MYRIERRKNKKKNYRFFWMLVLFGGWPVCISFCNIFFSRFSVFNFLFSAFHMAKCEMENAYTCEMVKLRCRNMANTAHKANTVILYTDSFTQSYGGQHEHCV